MSRYVQLCLEAIEILKESVENGGNQQLKTANFYAALEEAYPDEIINTIKCILNVIVCGESSVLILCVFVDLSQVEQILLVCATICEHRFQKGVDTFTFEDLFAIYSQKTSGISADPQIRGYFYPKVHCRLPF